MSSLDFLAKNHINLIFELMYESILKINLRIISYNKAINKLDVGIAHMGNRKC